MAHQFPLSVSYPLLRFRRDCLNSRSESPPKLSSHPRIYLTHLVKPYTVREKEGLARQQWFSERGRGYFAEQSTQPQTLGYSLADSPVGLLAWIYEKLVNWTDNYPWDDDEGMYFSSLRVSTPSW